MDLRDISKSKIVDINEKRYTPENIVCGSLQRIADSLEKQELPSTSSKDVIEIFKLMQRLNDKVEKKLASQETKISLLKKRINQLESKK